MIGFATPRLCSAGGRDVRRTPAFRHYDLPFRLRSHLDRAIHNQPIIGVGIEVKINGKLAKTRAVGVLTDGVRARQGPSQLRNVAGGPPNVQRVGQLAEGFAHKSRLVLQVVFPQIKLQAIQTLNCGANQQHVIIHPIIECRIAVGRRTWRRFERSASAVGIRIREFVGRGIGAKRCASNLLRTWVSGWNRNGEPSEVAHE
jgi:hypothetical protein